jgi:hypothetical protein
MYLVETPEDVVSLQVNEPAKLAYVTQTTLSVDNASEIDPQWISGKKRVGVTAGASAPEILVRAVIERLDQLGINSVTHLDGVQAKVAFPIPSDLATDFSSLFSVPSTPPHCRLLLVYRYSSKSTFHKHHRP